MFVTFEGIEGCGKTTHMGLAAERLASEGYPVVQTREPGGTRIGEQIRSVLLSPEHGNMSPVAELLLYEACRAQLIAELVRPELETGSLVLCDRYFDATTAYQGYGRGLDLDLIERLNDAAGQGIDAGPDDPARLYRGKGVREDPEQVPGPIETRRPGCSRPNGDRGQGLS